MASGTSFSELEREVVEAATPARSSARARARSPPRRGRRCGSRRCRSRPRRSSSPPRSSMRLLRLKSVMKTGRSCPRTWGEAKTPRELAARASRARSGCGPAISDSISVRSCSPPRALPPPFTVCTQRRPARRTRSATPCRHRSSDGRVVVDGVRASGSPAARRPSPAGARRAFAERRRREGELELDFRWGSGHGVKTTLGSRILARQPRRAPVDRRHGPAAGYSAWLPAGARAAAPARPRGLPWRGDLGW